jgi:hypothetical protein
VATTSSTACHPVSHQIPKDSSTTNALKYSPPRSVRTRPARPSEYESVTSV